MPEHYYKYGILLKNNRFCDISSAQALLDQKILFELYYWNTHLYYLTASGTYDRTEKNIKVSRGRKFTGGWGLLSVRTFQKWHTIEDSQATKINPNKSMRPMHLLFKDKEELKEWLGKDLYLELFVELI